MATFKAKLYDISGWTVVRLPADASAQLPSRGQVMVEGTIDGLPFQAPLEPDGNGSHWLNVSRAMRQSIKTEAGSDVTLAIEPAKDWIEPEVPADVRAAINAKPQVKALWSDITPMARWEWLRWIGSTSRPETRQRRIEVACSKMTAGSRRPCCFNRTMCCVPEVSKNGVLLGPDND